MYNKLFTKILDSSIWLAPDAHRLVWITLIAAMDEDSNAMFASAGNLAARARVTREQAEAAIAAFEAPDPDSGDDENDGRRIARFPGGWSILNGPKYRAMVTKAVIREQTRQRVARHRAGQGNTDVRTCNASVTPSEAEAEESKEKTAPSQASSSASPTKLSPAKKPGFDRSLVSDVSPEVLEEWLAHRKTYRAPVTKRVIEAFRREASKAGITLEAAFIKSCEKSWRGFEAAWLKDADKPAGPSAAAMTQAYLAEQDAMPRTPPPKAVLDMIRGAVKATP